MLKLSKVKSFGKLFIKNDLYVVFLTIFITFATSLIFLQGAIFNPELNYFLHNYLDDRPFLVKIFDSERHRDGAYQGREFSYVADYIDNNFLLLLFKMNIIVFYSLSHYVFIALIVIIVFRISLKYFGNKSKINYLLLMLLYLTSPPVFLGGGVFRSSKILVSFFITLIIYLFFRYGDDKTKQNKTLFFIGISIFLMTLSDLQGGFYALILIAITLFQFIIFRNTKYFKLLMIIILSNILYIIYFNFIGKFLILYFSGKQVWNLNYNSILTSWWIDALYYVTSAIYYVVYQFSYFWGSNNLFVGYLIIVISLVIYFSTLHPFKSPKNKTIARENKIKLLSLTTFFLILSTVVMIVSMLHYSPLFIEPYMRLLYYNLPIMTLLFLFFVGTIITFLNKWPKLNEIFHIIAVVAVTFNIFYLSNYFNIIKKNPFLKEFVESTPRLRECIKNPDQPTSNFSLPDQAYFSCSFLRAKLSGKKFILDSQQRVIMKE